MWETDINVYYLATILQVFNDSTDLTCSVSVANLPSGSINRFCLISPICWHRMSNRFCQISSNSLPTSSNICVKFVAFLASDFIADSVQNLSLQVHMTIWVIWHSDSFFTWLRLTCFLFNFTKNRDLLSFLLNRAQLSSVRLPQEPSSGKFFIHFCVRTPM